jgi:hypothetical protein
MIRHLAAALMTLLPLGAEAQPRCRFPGPFTRVAPEARLADGRPLVPIRIAADPSVIRRDGRYLMFFTTAGSSHIAGIARAESTDGRTWSVWRSPVRPDPLTDQMLATPRGSWDSAGIETADVLVGPDGVWRMYYTGNRPPEGSATYAIGLATSTDGIAWTRRATPVLEHANDWERPVCNGTACQRGGVLEPSVIYDATARQYRMWYVGLGEPANSFRTFRIGHATSPDGIAWTRLDGPEFGGAILDVGGPGTWDEIAVGTPYLVPQADGSLWMYYVGFSAEGISGLGLAMCDGRDLTRWRRWDQ